MRSQLWSLGYQMSLARQQKNHSVQLKKGQKGLAELPPTGLCTGQAGVRNGDLVKANVGSLV